MTDRVNGLLKFEPLKIITESRNAHGLRLQDPAAYHQYCARRVLHTKKQLKFVQRTKKLAPKVVTADLVANDPRLFVPLYALELTYVDTSKLSCFPSSEHGVRVQVLKPTTHIQP
jgi:RNA-binding signal recognition particle 68